LGSGVRDSASELREGVDKAVELLVDASARLDPEGYGLLVLSAAERFVAQFHLLGVSF
jgi:hypothetical protein